MRALATLLLCTAVVGSAQAQAGPMPVSARFAGMGQAGITASDLWSTGANQAGLAGLESPVAGVAWQQHWLAPDLALQGVAVAVPVGKGCFAASAHSFGNAAWMQRGFGLAWAMRLSETWRAGVQLDYLGLRLGEGYGSVGIVTAELGVQARLTEKLWAGAHLYNPGRSGLGGPYEEEVPTVLGAGLAYAFNERVTLSGQVDKDMDRPEAWHAGVEYRPMPVLFLRTGVSSGPVKAHFGAGLRVKQLELDLAAVLRSQLGLTPKVNLNWRFP